MRCGRWASSMPGSASTPARCWPGTPSLAESLVVGDAVNVAARLEQAAPPGEVFVGEATWALVAHAVEGERVAAVPAKGKSEPLAAWRLEAVDTAAVAQRRRLDLPMVGRESELDLLRWAARANGRGERPHLVTTLGQAGIGKSRLVSELPRLRDDVRLLVGHCRATSVSSSLEPLVEAVRGATSTRPHHRGGGRRPDGGAPRRGGGRRVPCAAAARLEAPTRRGPSHA